MCSRGILAGITGVLLSLLSPGSAAAVEPAASPSNADGWQVDVPSGVRYVETTAAKRGIALDKLRRAAAPGGAGFTAELVGDLIVSGPFLWNDLQIEAPVKDPPKKQVIFKISLGPVAMVMESKRFLASEAAPFLQSLNSYTKGETFAIRAPTARELELYWHEVPYDLEAPILVLESTKLTLLVDFQGGETVQLIEQLRPGLLEHPPQ